LFHVKQESCFWAGTSLPKPLFHVKQPFDPTLVTPGRRPGGLMGRAFCLRCPDHCKRADAD